LIHNISACVWYRYWYRYWEAYSTLQRAITKVGVGPGKKMWVKEIEEGDQSPIIVNPVYAANFIRRNRRGERGERTRKS